MFHRVAIHTLKTMLAVSLSLAVVHGQSVQLDPATKQSLDKARAAYLKKDFEIAKQELRRVQANKNNLAEPYLLLGMIAWHEGKIGDAIKQVKDALKYQPDYPEAQYILGKLYFEKSEWKKAEEAANLAISQGAKFANIYVLLGDALLVQVQPKQAVAAYEQAVKAPSPNSDVSKEMKERLEAVKNAIEIFAHKGESGYAPPGHIVDRSVGLPSFGVTGKVKIAGVLTERGEFHPFALVSSDAGPGKSELIRIALAYKFTPASINGGFVPFWLVMGYGRSFSVVGW